MLYQIQIDSLEIISYKMPQHSNEQNWEPDTISQCGALKHAQNDYTTYAISLISSAAA
jgi:hypothetical protein